MTPPKFILRFFSQIHIAVYRRSNGQRRNRMNGLPILLLTTTGRRTGKPFTVPVVYLTHGDAYLIAPGVVPRPDWYRNLKHDPRAKVQIGAQTFSVEAEELTGNERTRLWATVPDYWKAYERRAGIVLPLMKLRETSP
jgi:deazaflavin-dependent oxidoreductase (nitroreductase family)